MQGEQDPGEAAQAYEDELRNSFGGQAIPAFDLIILGVGEDGHTASLFPGSPSLQERDRLAVPVTLDPPKRDRVTLTLPVLNHASRIVFLASGRAKAPVVSAILKGDSGEQYPAGLVHPANGTVFWFIDQEATAERGENES